MNSQKMFLQFALFLFLTSFALIDKITHLGMWKGEHANEIGYLNMDKEGYAYFLFEGDTIGGRHYLVDDVAAYMKYEIDYSTAPKQIDFVTYEKAMNIEFSRQVGIFEFIGEDTLKLCVNLIDDERPTEFADDFNDLIIFHRVDYNNGDSE